MVDENEFFRQATLRISSGLDIEAAMARCMDYLIRFMPVSGMLFGLYDPELSVGRMLASVWLSRLPKPAETIAFPSEFWGWIKQRWAREPQVRIINNVAAEDPIRRRIFSKIFPEGMSHLIMDIALESKRIGVLELCAEEGLGVIVYNPLAGGVLTGKYARGATPAPGTRLGDMTVYQGRYLTEAALNLVDAFVAAAKVRGLTPAQLALAWVMAEPRVTCPIIGARTMAQLNDTIGGIDVKLSPAERATIPAMLPGRWVGVDPVYDRS